MAARNFNGGRVAIIARMEDPTGSEVWEYELHVTAESRGKRRPIVTQETVKHNGELVLTRPDEFDNEDPERLVQTALEQVAANRDFRVVNEFVSSTRYLHLVPQLIREPERGADRTDDPFGADFLAVVARTNKRDRERRLNVINSALRVAVPQLESLKLTSDDDGRPHLEARYVHWRKGPAKQDEGDFSDGTLRLIGLLWSLQERAASSGPILLEEPELSLHKEIVRQLPSMMARAAKSSGRQVIATTHAEEILEDPGLGPNEVVILRPSDEGTTAVLASSLGGVADDIDAGFLLSEALASELRPNGIAALQKIAF